ncbi:MAG: AMP-binding protein, partial [Gammaproteobacteria bacterium]
MNQPTQHETIKKSYFHRGGDEPLLGVTIPEHFANIVAQFPDREAVVSVAQEERYTYREFNSKIDELARGLAGIGYQKGDRIGVWSTNNSEWLLLQMATARIGAILVNINPAYRPRELAYALQRSEVQGLFVIPSFRSSDYIAMLAELVPELKDHPAGQLQCKDFPALRRVVVYEPSFLEHTLRPYSGFTTWQEVIELAPKVSMEQLNTITDSLDRDDAINIQYTSGTTGFPKAVVLSHLNILNNAYFSAHAMHFTEHDRLCISVPFYH